MDDTIVQLRNFKDFLQLYNSISEGCFSQCIDNFNSRHLDNREVQCADSCASKFVKFNHRLMAIYVNMQNILMAKRIEAAEKEQKVAEQAFSALEKQKENDSVAQEITVSEPNVGPVS